MFCVIQEIELKKANKHGYPKELISKFMQVSINSKDLSHYYYSYSEERFERPIRKAYKISIHKSYRENGKLKKKQYPLCTVNYYDIAGDWFSLYEYCSNKISAIAKELGIDENSIYELVQAKLDTLTVPIIEEFKNTEEFKTHEEHERITTLYAANKIQFAETYQCDQDKYDEIYDVFGNLMNKDKLEEVEAEFKTRQEYEKKSSSYQEQYYSNYNDSNSSKRSGYSKNIPSNYSSEEKETLKQFYRVLSKKFHPDANPDTDTSEQMKTLNQLKQQWGI